MNKQPRSDTEIRVAELVADRKSSVQQETHNPDGGDVWMTKAPCRHEDPELFHPASGDDLTLPAALAVCDRCPFHAACRARRYDTGATGVWGGVYYGPSARGKRPCTTRGCVEPAESVHNAWCGFEHAHAAKVGTKAGYQLHRRNGDEPCAACRAGRYDEAKKYDNPGQDSRGSGGAPAYRGMRAGRRVMA